MSTRSALHAPIAVLFPSKPIVGELDLIAELASEEEIHNEREPQHPRDKVAGSNAERSLRGKERSEFRRRSLPALQNRHHPLLVTREGRAVIAAAIAKLARKHVSLSH